MDGVLNDVMLFKVNRFSGGTFEEPLRSLADRAEVIGGVSPLFYSDINTPHLSSSVALTFEKKKNHVLRTRSRGSVDNFLPNSAP